MWCAWYSELAGPVTVCSEPPSPYGRTEVQDRGRLGEGALPFFVFGGCSLRVCWMLFVLQEQEQEQERRGQRAEAPPSLARASCSVHFRRPPCRRGRVAFRASLKLLLPLPPLSLVLFPFPALPPSPLCPWHRAEQPSRNCRRPDVTRSTKPAGRV
ncbi:unnamed protein product [Prorocentrum cordatum]|uniref:Uncharacterized protein n=1 Tax=Prorocentrum cordatum TaxID=2364126 RepID=A0ABN9XPU3_9DINO|nr:unnamed protein product [Polarella glacialis]